MQYDQVYSFLISKLETGLPSYLTYHDVQHTKDVILSAEHLAAAENIQGDELVLLKTAALFTMQVFCKVTSTTKNCRAG